MSEGNACGVSGSWATAAESAVPVAPTRRLLPRMEQRRRITRARLGRRS